MHSRQVVHVTHICRVAIECIAETSRGHQPGPIFAKALVSAPDDQSSAHHIGHSIPWQNLMQILARGQLQQRAVQRQADLPPAAISHALVCRVLAGASSHSLPHPHAGIRGETRHMCQQVSAGLTKEPRGLPELGYTCLEFRLLLRREDEVDSECV